MSQGGGVSHVPMVKRSQCIRIKNLLHKHFAGMPMVEGQGSKIVKICRRLKWMVPYLNRGCLLYLCLNLLKLLLNLLSAGLSLKRKSHIWTSSLKKMKTLSPRLWLSTRQQTEVGRGIRFSDKECTTNFSNFLFYSKQSISLSYLVKWMWMAVTTTTIFSCMQKCFFDHCACSLEDGFSKVNEKQRYQIITQYQYQPTQQFQLCSASSTTY